MATQVIQASSIQPHMQSSAVDPRPQKRARVDSRPEGPSTAPVRLTQPLAERPAVTSHYAYAMVCSSNINRSMEAHVVLQNNGFNVSSFGCGKQVRLPGPSGAKCFDFGTPYAQIVREISREDHDFYRKIGVLDLAKRASATKPAPERWQDTPNDRVCTFNVVICFESRLFDIVVADLQAREPTEFTPLHVICMDTKDTARHAVQQGLDVVKLCQQLEEADLSQEIPKSSLASANKGEIQYMLMYL